MRAFIFPQLLIELDGNIKNQYNTILVSYVPNNLGFIKVYHHTNK